MRRWQLIGPRRASQRETCCSGRPGSFFEGQHAGTRLVSESTLQLVTACLWDLRAQCEQQVRLMDQLQRLAVHRGISGSTKDRLEQQQHMLRRLDALQGTCETLAGGIGDCADLIRRLPPDQ